MIKTALLSLLLVPLLAFGQDIRILEYEIHTDVYQSDSLWFSNDTISGYTVTLDSIEFTDSTNFLICRATINGSDSTAQLFLPTFPIRAYHDSIPGGWMTITASPTEGDTIFLSDSVYITDASNKDTLNDVVFRGEQFRLAEAGKRIWTSQHPWGVASGSAKITYPTVTTVIDSCQIVVSVDATADTGNTTAVSGQFDWYQGSAVAYADNDIIGFPFSLALGGKWGITGVSIVDSADDGADMTLLVYDTVAVPLAYDNAAFNTTFVTGAKLTAICPITTDGTEETDFARSVYSSDGPSQYLIGDQHLTGILISAGTPTFTGSRLLMRIMLKEQIK